MPEPRLHVASLTAQQVKNLPAIQEMKEMRVLSLGREDSLGEENGNPLQHCCLKKSHEQRGAWKAIVHGVSKSQTQRSNTHTHTHTRVHHNTASATVLCGGEGTKPAQVIAPAFSCPQEPPRVFSSPRLGMSDFRQEFFNPRMSQPRAFPGLSCFSGNLLKCWNLGWNLKDRSLLLIHQVCGAQMIFFSTGLVGTTRGQGPCRPFLTEEPHRSLAYRGREGMGGGGNFTEGAGFHL